jgi:DNA-binding transcriptional LysR family regulator
MRFTFRQLQYFIATGELGSIALAAERLNISPSSISTAISHLERELGIHLFVRLHAQGLSPTPAGRAMLAKARQVVEQAKGLQVVASEAIGQVRGQLTVGYLELLAPMLMPALSRSFTEAFPEARILHTASNQDHLLEGLHRAEIDVAVTYDLQLPQGIAFVPLVRLPPHAVLADGHPFGRRSAVRLSELAAEPLVLLDLASSREYVLSLFIREGLKPAIALRSDCQEVVRSAVANGYGFAVANERPRTDMAMDGRRVVRVPLAGEHRPLLIGTARSLQMTRSRLVDAFEAHCRAEVTEAQVPGMRAPVDAPTRSCLTGVVETTDKARASVHRMRRAESRLMATAR